VKLRRAWLLYEFGDTEQARSVIDAVIVKARADRNLSLETVARGMRAQAPGDGANRGPHVAAPALPAEQRIAEVLQRYAVAPEDR
jgi:hypothetical protein